MKNTFVLLLGLALLWTAATVGAGWSKEVEQQLASSKYVYVSTQRKDGSFGKPAEIWFLYRQGAVWVASPPTTWRVRRIKAGRTKAKIAVGKVDGPSFEATGAIVAEPEVNKLLCDTFAKKYPDGWPKYESSFRKGLADGSRVLIKYTRRD